ncbi:MBL fold metallo-hydrolase [bacterium]|nr:MBL fold metallo-hydrolase [bacterium]
MTAMMEERGLRLLAMDEAILPGLTALPTPGHTPGHIGLLFESAGERLLHLADLLHSPMQIVRPDWSAAFDADTSLSVPSREAALARAADTDALVMFYHLSFPGMGRVERHGTAFTWSPLALESGEGRQGSSSSSNMAYWGSCTVSPSMSASAAKRGRSRV